MKDKRQAENRQTQSMDADEFLNFIYNTIVLRCVLHPTVGVNDPLSLPSI